MPRGPTRFKHWWVNPCCYLVPPARERNPGAPAALQLPFPLLLALTRERFGLGGTFKPSSFHLPCCGGFTSCTNSLLIVPFSSCSHEIPAGISPRREAAASGGNRREHNAFLPSHSPNSRASDVTCIFLPEAGTGWEGLSHAGLCRQLTSGAC